MNIDTGLAVVIVAVLVFYLRLILLQRERAKRLAQTPLPAKKQSKRQKSPPQIDLKQRYSILSTRRSDLVIAGLGILCILAGILFYMSVLPFPTLQSYWWLPTAAGIVAFSWAFRL